LYTHYFTLREETERRKKRHKKKHQKASLAAQKQYSAASASPLLEAILLALVEQVGLGGAQVHDLGAAVAILLQHRTLLAVVRVRHSRTSTDDAAALVGAVVALVTDAHQRARAHVRVADHTLAVVLLAEAPNGYSGLLAAEDQVWVMLRHCLAIN